MHAFDLVQHDPAGFSEWTENTKAWSVAAENLLLEVPRGWRILGRWSCADLKVMFLIRPWGLFRGCKSDLLRDVLVESVVCLCWVSGIHSTLFSVNDLGSSINLGRRNPNSSHPCHPCAPLPRLVCVSLSRLRALKRWKQKLVAMSQSCWRWGFKTAAGLKGVDLNQPTQRHLLELDCQRRTWSYHLSFVFSIHWCFCLGYPTWSFYHSKGTGNHCWFVGLVFQVQLVQTKMLLQRRDSGGYWPQRFFMW